MSNQRTPKKDVSETRSTVRYTVPPDIISKIALNTLPGAICDLYLDDESKADRRLRLYADQSGTARFYAGPAKESKINEKLVIDCSVGGKVIRIPVELRIDSNPTSDMPAPHVEYIRSAADKVRPGLSEQEMVNLSGGELIKRGYPHRPNPKKAPEAFSKWKKRVSRPQIIVDPRSVAEPYLSSRPVVKPKVDLHTDAQTTFNDHWSGAVMFSNPGQAPWYWVGASWPVPSVTGNIGTNSYAWAWVGIDGWDTTPNCVVQGGTESNYMGGNQSPLSVYYGWHQYWGGPDQNENQHGAQIFMGFNIGPGTEILATVAFDVDCFHPPLTSLNPPCTSVTVSLWDETNPDPNIPNPTVSWTYQLGNFAPAGACAEAIMERSTLPDANGNLALTDLANYNALVMQEVMGAYFLPTPTYPGGPYCDEKMQVNYNNPTAQVTMINSAANTLSSCDSISGVGYGSINLTWHAAD
ncbi:MAG: G1 family glutamic endopeptidase [Candidatus Nitrosopolaris sp.]